MGSYIFCHHFIKNNYKILQKHLDYLMRYLTEMGIWIAAKSHFCFPKRLAQ